MDFRNEIEGWIREWAVRLDLQHWTIVVDFEQVEHLATCLAEPEYMKATLSFNLPRLETDIGSDTRALEELVVHELVHARLWAVANYHRTEDSFTLYLEEEAVTQVTGALLRAKYNTK